MVLQAYLRQLRQRPFTTKCAAAVSIFGGSDATCQLLIEGKPQLDAHRLLSRAGAGAVVVCWVHPWWGWLEPRVERVFSFALEPWKNTLLKVAIDQTVGAGSVNTMYLTYVALSDGEGLRGTVAYVRTLLPGLLAAHWSIFPLYHTFNFRFVPLEHRVLAQNALQVGWSGFLSYRYRPSEPEEEVGFIKRTTSARPAAPSPDEGGVIGAIRRCGP